MDRIIHKLDKRIYLDLHGLGKNPFSGFDWGGSIGGQGGSGSNPHSGTKKLKIEKSFQSLMLYTKLKN